MESLVDEKVDAFWKGVDGGASKSGQIVVTFSEKRPKKTTWFQVYAGEVRLSSVRPPQLLIIVFLQEEIPWEQWYFGCRKLVPII
jgi:autophagy-related protein 101